MSTFLAIFLFTISILFLIFKAKASPRKHLPPGSLGLPIIGQSLTLLRTMRANTAEQWLGERVKKYGFVSKLSLFGKPTVFIYGQAANKLVFAGESGAMTNHQTTSVRMILGDRNLLELVGDDHKRVREALVSFLKPDCLKQYVGEIEGEIRRHLELHWEDLAKMKYTSRVVMETLRLFPPIFGGFRKAMDATIFQEPSNFDPSRFENQSAIPPYCYVPFGGGTRICPGNEFARIETLVTMHYLVTRYTWKLCLKDDKFSRDPMPVPTQGLPILITPKKAV